MEWWCPICFLEQIRGDEMFIKEVELLQAVSKHQKLIP